jgi:spermidine/putrescine ABC transporter ATP-binding subunit
MAGVFLSGVTKKYGDVAALHELDLEIQEGEFLTLLGPSGCGKTTTLRLVAGFIQPTTGTIYLGDDDITAVAPQHRKIGMVFQDYALFPHMTVQENIAFGLEERRYDKHRISERVDELLELIRLPDMGDRYPSEVSGGQQQRIAVARAVAFPPRVLLMDEPLGALDLKLREAMQIEIRRIQRELKITTVYVTHDQTEAMNMSDRIAVMNHGVIEQLGSAEEIYNRPATRFVADFVGQINLLSGRVVGEEGEWIVVEAAGVRVRASKQDSVGTVPEISLGIRPELLKALANDDAPAGMNALDGRIAGRTFAGNLLHVYVDIDDGTRVVLEARPQDPLADNGSAIRLGWWPDDTIVLTR